MGNVYLASFSYRNCDAGAEVKYFIVANTGHGRIEQQADLIAFGELWSFFHQH